jgi:uncharacterized protein
LNQGKTLSNLVTNLWTQKTESGILLKVHINPRSSRNCISGIQNDSLSIKITAPAIEGKANKMLEEFIAESLGIKTRQVTIVSGKKSRDKIISISDITPENLLFKLGTLVQE